MENTTMQLIFKITFTIFIMLVLATVLSAQTDFSVTSYLIRDNNAFQNRTAYDEWINNSSVQIGHRFKSKTYQIHGYYNADISQFANNNELNNYAHKFGIAYAHDYNNYSLHIGGFARLHNYQEQFVYYSVNRYNFNMNVQYNPNLKSFYSAGITINKDKYKEFDDLDNVAYRLYGNYQRFFQSRISFTCNAGLGIKNYVNQSIIQYYGFGGFRNFARYREDAVKAAMFSLSANVGKSITSLMGISLGVGGQWFIGDPIMSFSEGIYYYTENDLFDDPYSYQNQYVTLQLTKQFAIDFQGKIGFKLQKKDYAGTPALNETGDLTGDTRKDIRSEYFLFLTKKFKTGWRFPGSIDVFFNYMYRNNPSNDPYYDFQDHIGLVGFSISK